MITALASSPRWHSTPTPASASIRGFADIDVDAEGVAHAAWIDGRFAPRGAEEPAELYYARIDGSEVTEINLTEEQVDSVCACCRVDIDLQPDQEVIIAFRNTGGGYRDIHRVTGTTGSEFGEPIRLGPPMWELNGCPVIGPLNVGEATLWSEASTGKRRLLVATATDGNFEIVIGDSQAWRIDRPPRIVAEDGGEALLLLPGRPTGLLLKGSRERVGCGRRRHAHVGDERHAHRRHSGAGWGNRRSASGRDPGLRFLSLTPLRCL